ncbi:Translin, partial [Jaminaea rosea]
ILSAFDTYRSEIDAHNDRRERLIKASRDITNLSKKLIFHLHRLPPPAHLSNPKARVATSAAPPPHSQRMLNEAAAKQSDIVSLIRRTAYQEDLAQGHAASLRYERNLGGGLEEFIEALSFHHYLLHGTLITHEEVQALFQPGVAERYTDGMTGEEQQEMKLTATTSCSQIFPVPTHRYLLGISDLTGELMRFATNALGGGGGGGKGSSAGPPSDPGTVVRSVLALLRDIREGLEPFVFLIHDMRKKQAVTTASLRKIEDLSYNISIRMSEFGGDEKAIREMVRRALAGGNS